MKTYMPQGSVLVAIVMAAFLLAGCAAHNVLPAAKTAGLDGGRIAIYGSIDEFPIPNCPNSYCQPIGITLGPDGQVWFSNYLYETPGEVDSNGVFTQFTLSGGNGYLYNIATGSDGNLWMTSPSNPFSQIVKMTPTGQATFFDIPGQASRPIGIAPGSDGNIWFTDSGRRTIGRITTDGLLTEFTLAKKSHPVEITAGPDGNMWFTDEYFSQTGPFLSKIGMITPQGVIKEFTVHNGGAISIFNITTGPDGRLWFTDGNRIGRMKTSGGSTEYSLPNSTVSAYGIAVGPDKNVWVAEVGEIVRVNGRDPDEMTEYFLPAVGDQNPENITAGSDGNMWFTIPGIGAIGRIHLH